MENIDLLLKELLSQPAETPYIEFKANNSTPQMIGEDISAHWQILRPYTKKILLI